MERERIEKLYDSTDKEDYVNPKRYECYECGLRYGGHEVCEDWEDGESHYLCRVCHNKHYHDWAFEAVEERESAVTCNCNCNCNCKGTTAKVVEPLKESTLYVVMRHDLASMNPGKAMAQAAHAGQMFQAFVDSGTSEAKKIAKDFNGDRDFGRTIVLAAPDGFTQEFMDTIGEMPVRGVVHDPTYPLRDGRANLLVGVDTCVWVYVEKGQVPPKVLTELELHP